MLCLKELAEVLTGCINGSSEVIVRFGGEECLVLLPYTSLEGAVLLAESVRLAAERTSIPLAKGVEGEPTQITVSGGVASIIPDPADQPKMLLSAADGALYKAKASGRNRVCYVEDIRQPSVSDGVE